MNAEVNKRAYLWRGAWIITAMVLVPAALAGAPPDTLSMEEAALTAIRSNTDLEQAAYGVETSRLAADRATFQFLPSLRLSSLATHSEYMEYDMGIGDYVDAESDALNAGVSLELDLFTGFRRSAARARTGSEAAAAVKVLDRARQTAVYRAATGFMKAATRLELVRANEENLEAQEIQLELVRASYQAGKRPVADLYQQQAETARAEVRLIESRRAYQSSRLDLLLVLGMDPGEEMDIAFPDLASVTSRAPEFYDPEVIENALESRPDAIAQKERVAAAEEGVRISRAGYWPTLSLSADLSTGYSSAGGGVYDFEDQFLDNNVSTTVAVSLSIPLFDRLVTRTSVAESEVSLRSSRLELDDLERRVETDVRDALLGYRTAHKQVEAAAAQMRYAEESLNAFTERYRVGASTLAELAQARAAYLESRYGLIEAGGDLISQALAVYYHSGNLDGMMSLIAGCAVNSD
jgi:outer membrane protein